MSYEEKFREVENRLRPRKSYKHEEAVDILATIPAEADEEIFMLRVATIGFAATSLVLLYLMYA